MQSDLNKLALTLSLKDKGEKGDAFILGKLNNSIVLYVRETSEITSVDLQDVEVEEIVPDTSWKLTKLTESPGLIKTLHRGRSK